VTKVEKSSMMMIDTA